MTRSLAAAPLTGAQFHIGRTALPEPLLGSILFITLGLMVPLFVISTTPDDGYAAWVGCLAVSGISAARFAWAVSTRERHIVDMVVSVFVYGFLGIAPMVQLRDRAELSTTPGFVEQYAWQSVTVVLVGYGMFIVGSFLGRRLAPSDVGPEPKNRQLRGSAVLITTLLAFAVTAYYVNSLGVGALFHTRSVIDGERAATWSNPTTAALVTGFSNMGLLVAAVAQILLFRQRRANGHPAPFVLMTVSLMVLLVVVNPISSPRYTVGTVYVALLAACGAWSSLRKYRIVSVSLLTALFFLFPIASTFRNSIDAKVQFRGPLESLLSGDFDSFYQINNSVYFISSRGITWGEQLLGVVLFWVPRDLWPDKAVDTGILLAQFRNYSFTNLSAPLWAELMVNGSWPLLVAGMAVIGFAVRRWDGRLDWKVSLVGTPGVIGCIVPVYLLIVLRGSLLQSMASLSVILLFAWLLSAGRTGNNPEIGRSNRLSRSSAAGEHGR